METGRYGGRFPAWEIARINLKHNARLSIAVAVVLCLLTPLLIGTANLDEKAAAMPLEMFISLIGVILLTPVFQPEQDEEVHDLVSSKYIRTIQVYGVRTGYGIAIAFLLIGLFTVYMGVKSCDVTLPLALGTMADALFLGGIGMCASAFGGNTVVGYMPPLLYYALNIGMGPKLGNFYLFSMMIGEYGPKLWMAAAGILLIGISLTYKGRRMS